MKRMLSAICFIVVNFILSSAYAADETESIRPLLNELERLGKSNLSKKEEFSRLNSSGINELSAVWDYFFPESSVSPKTETQIALLLAELREPSLDRRERATRELTAVARHDRRPLITAAMSKEIEVELRCKSVLMNIDKSQELQLAPYSSALAAFVRQLPDDARIPLLAVKTSTALQKGPVPDRTRGLVLSACLERIAVHGKEEQCNILLPALQGDERTARFVTENIGSHRDSQFFPDLLLEALRSKHSSVVMEAISWTPHCWDEKKRPLVEEALKSLFHGKDEALKFQACFPLMHGYDDADAMKYLVEQAASVNRSRKINAVGWIGDSCNWNKPLTPQIRDALVPLLSSTDKDVRRAAGDAIGTYSGVEVIDNLIGLLNDSEGIIIQEAIRNLKQKDKDKALVVQRLKVRIADFPMKSRHRLEMLVDELSVSNASLKTKSPK